MRMKKVCEATGLTERAIRLYMKKGLITPRLRDGLTAFDNEDIRVLRDIALLRRMGFAVEEIAALQQGAVGETVAHRLMQAQQEAVQAQETMLLLTGLAESPPKDLDALTETIRRRRPLPEPDFRRMDEDSEIPPVSGVSAHWRWMGWCLVILLALAGVVITLLALPRMTGYVPVGPFTVESINGEEITVQLEQPETIALLGRSRLTVPYQAGRETIMPGMHIDKGCQLVLRISGRVLMQSGVSPWMRFRTPYPFVTEAWVKTALHALTEDLLAGAGTLYIHEYAGVRPLLP